MIGFVKISDGLLRLYAGPDVVGRPGLRIEVAGESLSWLSDGVNDLGEHYSVFEPAVP